MLPHSPALSVSESSPVLAYIHAKFREVFGEPSTTLAKDSQWTIRPSGQAPAIFVLVNGSYEKPAVWVFDPYAAESVWRTATTSKDEVNWAIEVITARIAAATKSLQPQ